jgi:hypothetical protein
MPMQQNPALSAQAPAMPPGAGAGQAGATPALMPRPGAMLHDLKLKRTKKHGRVQIDNVPPEEFLISRDGASIDTARFVGHRVEKTVSELKAMGFDEKLIDELTDAPDSYWSTEKQERASKDDEQGTSPLSSKDPSQRLKAVVEGYYRIDYDGDGVAELRQVWSGVTGGPILRNEIWNGPAAPMASLCPVPIPHRFFGLSEADLVMDLQLIKSTVLRQLLDNMYNVNNQRTKVLMATEDGVNLDDLMTNRPGGIVRMKPGSDVAPMESISLGPWVIPLMEQLSAIQEKRSGVTAYNQGLDADSLNKTYGGIQKIMNASQERQLLVARIFAETGFKDLMRGILQLECEHRTNPRCVKLGGKWVDMDPRAWATLTDISINVGLGTGDKQEEFARMLQIMQIQSQIALNGLTNIVGPKQIYNSAAKITTLAGQKTADPYFQDPENAPAAPPKPDPEMMKAQAQMMLENAKAQHKAMLDESASQHKAQLEQMRAMADMEIERAKAQASVEAAAMKAQLTAHVQMHATNAKAAAGAFTPQPTGGE